VWGYFLAAFIAIPLRFLIGMSSVAHKALNPFIQVLRPISPLCVDAASFVYLSKIARRQRSVTISLIWPMLINTAFQGGVRRSVTWPAPMNSGLKQRSPSSFPAAVQ
jgi:ABC-type nitrate/sulfonate/bicarbonate transport system permease component